MHSAILLSKPKKNLLVSFFSDDLEATSSSLNKKNKEFISYLNLKSTYSLTFRVLNVYSNPFLQ
jgi:hypothetical protein